MGVARTLIGRQDELETLVGALDAAVEGAGSAILIEGPPGIGKSSLVRALQTLGPTRGARVRAGQARELDGELPFAALADAFALHPGSDDPERASLGQLLAGAAEVDAEQRRWRVATGLADLLEAEASAQPVLLIIEDVHWLGAASVAVLQRLVGVTEHRPVVVVLTARPEPRAPHLEALTRGLGDVLRALPLGALSDADVARLAARQLEGEPGATVLDALARASGNPLYVVELLDAFRESGAVEVRDGRVELSDLGLPPSLRLTIVRRLGFLPASTVRALRHAAVLGSSARPEVLTAMLGVELADVGELLEPGYRSGLLVADATHVSFRHALIREALYEDVPVTSRLAMHRAAAELLTQLGARPSEVAAHLAAGLGPGSTQEAQRLIDVAAALVDLDPGGAERHVHAALSVLPAEHASRRRANIVAAQAAVRAGRPAEAEVLVSDLDDAGAAPGEHIDLLHTVVVSRYLRGRVEPTLLARYHLAAHGADLADAVRRWHLAVHAFVSRWTLLDPGYDLPALLTETGEPPSRALLLAAIGTRCLVSGDVHGAYEWTARAVDTVRAAGAELSWVGIEALGAFAFPRSIDPHETEAARRALEAAIDAADRSGLVYAVPRLLTELARTLWFAGRHDEAQAHADAALELREETGYDHGADPTEIITATIAALRGDTDEAARQLTSLRDRESVLSAELPFHLAKVSLQAGDADAAWQHAQTGAQLAAALGPAEFVTAIWMLPYVEAALVGGHDAEAAACAERLRGLAQRSGDIPPVRAVAAVARALVERSVVAAQEAVTAVGEAAVFPFRLDGLYAASQVLAEHDRRDEAVEVLREGRSLAEGAGATWVVARYDAALRDLGVRRGATGRGRPDRGWDSVTDAEWRVTELVAEGLSYREIGERLFVSRRTVETHVANVRRKLDLRSRNELTRAYLDRQMGAAT